MDIWFFYDIILCISKYRMIKQMIQKGDVCMGDKNPNKPAKKKQAVVKPAVTAENTTAKAPERAPVKKPK